MFYTKLYFSYLGNIEKLRRTIHTSKIGYLWLKSFCKKLKRTLFNAWYSGYRPSVICSGLFFFIKQLNKYLGMERRNEELMLLPQVARGFHITDI